MSRILGANPDVFRFNELHFFEQLWDPTHGEIELTEHEAIKLAARLLAVERSGYFNTRPFTEWLDEAEQVIARLHPPVRPVEVYAAFLKYECDLHGKHIACEHTPRNLYYAKEIIETFPNAIIVQMVRDPRDVLVSQKNRWRRRILDNGQTPRIQAVRTWAGYHPWTISMMWKSAVEIGYRFCQHPQIRIVKFEDVLLDPEEHVGSLCASLGLDFHPDMLSVSRVGSSNRPDKATQVGLDPDVIGKWKDPGVLSSVELFICERVTRDQLRMYNYDSTNVTVSTLRLIPSIALWLFKSTLSLLLNWRRVRHFPTAISRRFPVFSKSAVRR